MTDDKTINVIDYLSDEQLEKIGYTRETFKGSKTELFLQCLLEGTEQTINEDTQRLMKEYNLSFGEARSIAIDRTLNSLKSMMGKEED